jgi:hypothetical protein
MKTGILSKHIFWDGVYSVYVLTWKSIRLLFGAPQSGKQGTGAMSLSPTRGEPMQTGERVVDSQLLSERIQIERKQFFFDLKENPRGRFLKITEEVGGRRDTIIIPSTGLDLFLTTVEKAIEADKANGNGNVAPE